MKKLLSAEQSATLISKGISADKASGQGEKIYKPITLQNGSIKRVFDGYTPIFTLADLLSLVPKVIENGLFNLELQADNNGWDVIYSSYHEGYDSYYVASDKELVNTLYSALIWAIGHGYIDLTK